MLCVVGVSVLLLLLLLPPQSGAQSGDSDSELRLSCTSHIMTTGCSLSCGLVGGRSFSEDDDDDEEADSIQSLTLCSTSRSIMREACRKGRGATLSSAHLSPVDLYNVTAHLRRGSPVSTLVKLTSIVKPWSPQVVNVSFHSASNQVVFLIQTPYRRDDRHREYLRVENQLFQLHIWTEGYDTVQNITSSDVLKIDAGQLKASARYHIRVRALPIETLRGTWSEWSQTLSFDTPEGDEVINDKLNLQVFGPISCLLLLLLAPFVLFVWKKKEIFSYMWPKIPHPKGTLVQICSPNKGALLNLRPEEFSFLKVVPMEEPEEWRRDDFLSPAADGSSPTSSPTSSPPCSTQTSDCSTTTTSVSTEELELSALLGHCSSHRGDDHDLQSPSPVNAPQEEQRPPTSEGSNGGGVQVEVFGVNQPDEAYVTMSSFLQIKQ